MKALITKEANINVEWVGIISAEEYRRYKSYISDAHHWWWLRTPGATSDRAAYVTYDNELNAFGEMVDNSLLGIRPAIRIDWPVVTPGGKILINGEKWTALSGTLLLKDEIIYTLEFNVYEDREDSNIYEGSDLEREIEYWWTGLAFDIEHEEKNDV